mmetsp:Transcript_81202/g.238603  ORF Transcript_81202/g.238603 Transcript_81202/m.238603 type:complete len:106 (-) Transcript_81202:158-475(-)
MRADEAALVALRALIHIDAGNFDRNSALLILAGSQRDAATRLEYTDRQIIAIEAVARPLNLLSKVLGRRHYRITVDFHGIAPEFPRYWVRCLSPCLRNWNFNNAI